MARFEKGMTQRALASRINVDPSYISNIEKGKASLPSEDVLRRIASELDLNFQDLLSLSGISIDTFVEIDDPAMSEVMRIAQDLEFSHGNLTAFSLSFVSGEAGAETSRELHCYKVMNRWRVSLCPPNSSKGKRLRKVAGLYLGKVNP